MKIFSFLILISFLLFCSNSSDSKDFPQNKKVVQDNVDLINGKFHGIPISELTIATITDTLGRPSHIKEPEANLGSQLFYPDEGLWFIFNHPKKDSTQRCIELFIYFNKTFDKNSSEYYLPYKGTISRGISDSWKKNRLFEVFSDFNPIDLYDAEKVANSKKAFNNDKETLKFILSIYCRLRIKTEAYQIDFQYEETAEFLEIIIINVLNNK